MKKIIILLCLAILATTAFASCTPGGETGGVGEGGGCEHPLSTEWECDENSHWNPTSCEHGEYRGNFGVHTDANEDGKCDVCDFDKGHIHTYSSEWESDAYYHWRVATCSHTGKTIDLSAHVDDDLNGECDMCEGHVHVIDATGRCGICNTQVRVVDTSNMSQVIAAIVGAQVNVNGGKITSNFIGRYASGAQSDNRTEVVDYLIGNGSIHYSISKGVKVQGTDRDGNAYVSDLNNYTEKWLNREADNSIFSVYQVTSNGVAGKIEQDVANENNLFGHYYSVSTLADGYGAEGILKALYDKSQERYSADFTVEENEGSYKFSFKYTAINTTNTSDGQGNALGLVTNVNHFVVNVEFSYDADYTLTALSIKCDCYTNDAGSNLQGDLDIDNIDLEYAAQTGGIILLEGAQADTYTITVEQTVGERTYENPYPKAAFAPASFEIYSDRDGTIVAPDTITISLTNLPEDEYYPYVRFRVMPTEEGKIFTDADEITFTSSNDAGLKFASFDPVRKMGSFLAKEVGTYTVTVSVNGTVKTFTVIVEA